MSDRRRRLVPRWSPLGKYFRGRVAQSAIAQSYASLHVQSCLTEIRILGVAKSVLHSGVCHWGVDQLNCSPFVICLNDFGGDALLTVEDATLCPQLAYVFSVLYWHKGEKHSQLCVAGHEQCVLLIRLIESFLLYRDKPFHVCDIIRGNLVGSLTEVDA